MKSFYCLYTVSCSNKCADYLYEWAFWRKTAWCLHTWCKWIVKQTQVIEPVELTATCDLWWSCLRSFAELFVFLSWCSLNAARTRVQQSSEPSTHLCWMDFWKTLSVLCFRRLEEQQTAVATSGKILLGGCFIDELSHVCMNHKRGNALICNHHH